MKKALTVFILLVGAFISLWFYSLFTPVVTDEHGVVYYLRPGTSKAAALSELANQGLLPYPTLFSFYAGLDRHAYLKTGEYLFPKGSTPFSIWRQLTQGTGHYYHSLTIIPGWSFTQLRQALSQADGLRHLTAQQNDQYLMSMLGHANLAPEGEFFPETYLYTRGVTDLLVLKHAFDLMQKKLDQAWQQRAPDLPYKTPYEALIAASLIEKEAHLEIERPIIAGVLVNRLRKGMLLQCDPTVIYGMGTHYTGKIHKENLLKDTPYNTYIHTGLPPTPIAMPSMLSIEAALHPQQNDYYYFVAKGDGSHQFSKTYKNIIWR